MTITPISFGECRHRGDLRRALDAAVEYGVERVRQQLAAAGFHSADLWELVACERKRLVAWRDQVEAEIGADLPEAPPAASAA